MQIRCVLVGYTGMQIYFCIFSPGGYNCVFQNFNVYYFFVLSKFTLVYCFISFLQIRHLVDPTNVIVTLRNLHYSWHDLVSSG